MPFGGTGHRGGARWTLGEDRVLRATRSKPLAAPSGRHELEELAHTAGGTVERMAHPSTRRLGRRALFVVVNLLVVAVVMSIPFIKSTTAGPSAHASAFSAPIGSTSLALTDGEPTLARAAPEARGGTIAAGRNPVTVQAEGVRPIQEYTLSANDTLWTIANFYGLTAESIAFANGISDPYQLQVGRQIMIPPLEGALYTVADGDTVESVAERFKVDPAVIKDYNRLYFEPEHFAPGQLIFVENAVLPTLPPPPVDAAPAPSLAPLASRVAITAPRASFEGLFPWVPAGGFPDPFPFGQCTWWAAYNYRVTWRGNAGDWLANARAQGVATSATPTVGAIAVYRPGGASSPLGHVAIVIAVSGTSYTVSEMNAPFWGRVTTRSIAWPDGQLEGFIPVS
jgi:N-acetylmuramoyl-L-alanine amidase